MDRKTSFALVGLVALGHFGAARATAQSNVRVGEYVARRTTLPGRTLRFDFGPYEHGINDSGILLGPYDESAYGLRFIDYDNAGGDDVHVMLGLGLSYGVVDDVEIGVLAAPINFAQGQKYGDLTSYVRWAFVNESHAQVGLQGTVQFPTWSNFGVGLGLPMNFRLGDVARLETGVEAELVFDEVDRDGDGDDDPRLAIDVPIALGFNLTPRGYLGGRADLLWDGLILGPEAFRVGAGAYGGFTLLDGRPHYVDFTGSFMGYFRDSAIDWEIVLGANIALDL